MKTIIIILIVFVWLLSFVKFKRKMKYFSVMVAYLQSIVRDEPSPDNLMRLSSALCKIQHYKDASAILERLIDDCRDNSTRERLRTNLEFCKNPVPGTHQPKNFNQSWWHNFILARLGKRRHNFLTEDDFLQTNAIMRNM